MWQFVLFTRKFSDVYIKKVTKLKPTEEGWLLVAQYSKNWESLSSGSKFNQ